MGGRGQSTTNTASCSAIQMPSTWLDAGGGGSLYAAAAAARHPAACHPFLAPHTLGGRGYTALCPAAWGYNDRKSLKTPVLRIT